ncbi:phosphoenolpyruvate carboxykinase (ATP) [Halosquirtibacter xylanolyticus]|uniref:phosphoenolpyruvate carboxykinase (ATP) n=1 Tax=Halosquirtibacter xylanolyticus TaxID=3374599 RepID=UPI003749B2DC|nr:phosphoenolpyruvate carboxykinase (ATP) [Prolixibacteraceae bacterium]
MTHSYLSEFGIGSTTTIVHQPTYDELFILECDPALDEQERGVVTSLGAVSVDTGVFTGRTPKDKYILMDHHTDHRVWWTSQSYPNDNKPISPEIWSCLLDLVTTYLDGKYLYVVDVFCGMDPQNRRKVRVVTEIAWQAHFALNMFVRPNKEELRQFDEPDFLVLCASRVVNREWKKQGLNSENFVAFNFEQGVQVIGGTWYGGEIKKGVFSMMNYFLPLEGIPTMHCAANQGEKDDVALFFGLSGTGKTTLSTDDHRELIGDDEHAWCDRGVFNLEGGCYAKTARLSLEKEPEIFHAIRRDALLENVTVLEDGQVDFYDVHKTENGRVSYPIYHIDHLASLQQSLGHPNKIVLLTADAFGVFPPISKLTETQFLYHFLSGYTSKVSGTEQGVLSPIPTFSACYGAAFLSLPPMTYASLLLEKIRVHKTEVFLVNSGWDGNGERYLLSDTRRIVQWALSEEVNNSEFELLPIFNLRIPRYIDGLNTAILDPRNCYEQKHDWESRAFQLGEDFIENFNKYQDITPYSWIINGGPIID